MIAGLAMRGGPAALGKGGLDLTGTKPGSRGEALRLPVSGLPSMRACSGLRIAAHASSSYRGVLSIFACSSPGCRRALLSTWAASPAAECRLCCVRVTIRGC